MPLLNESGVKIFYLGSKGLFHLWPGAPDQSNNATTGSFACTDVHPDFSTMVSSIPPSGCFTGDTYSTGWTWAKYVEGQRELAQKMVVRVIQYAIATNGGEFLGSHPNDDPNTDHDHPASGQTPASVCADNDATVGTTCENDDWRYITAHAAFIWFTDDCTACGNAFRKWISGKNIPYVRTTSQATIGACLDAVP